ncbi:MAG: glycine--tRNA ligase [Planctomycetota bacterium]|nr:glycine--tRNA ligase [Planctomycetota bacterium]
MAQATEKTMDSIVALCRRRGFIFQSSEIYGGINGFWDYGPMGAALKRNLKNAWWEDIVERELPGPDGTPVSVVGLESTIIMNPRVWEASGHVGGFNDPMVDCKDSKARYRADHVLCLGVRGEGGQRYAFLEGDDDGLARARKKLEKYTKQSLEDSQLETVAFMDLDAEGRATTVGPDTREPGTLTEPRMFNLMFETHCGAIRNDDAKAYLRPETAQGIFVNFHNVVDSSRVRVPFGIAQMGKSFRNEVTPRNFTFRSREFEQMELEFFIHPDEARTWYEFWRDQRYAWWKAIGLAGDNLILRDHDPAELAHYAKDGAGVCDVEYKFPFTDPGFGELEGVAHRSDYDLRQHAEHCGKGDKWRYLDQATNERYFPHVIEPSAGADRGTLALICEAFTPDDSRASKVYMNFEPRVAPIKAGIFPLVKKDGMPEVAEKLYRELRRKHVVEFDEKQSIGKRYARMDEAGTPYCLTIDGDTASDQAVTVRERNTQSQERVALDKVAEFLDEKIGS